MNDVDVLLYTHKNYVTMKEELQQLNDVFKLIDEINQEMIELDENHTENMWFSDIDDKVFGRRKLVKGRRKVNET